MNALKRVPLFFLAISLCFSTLSCQNPTIPNNRPEKELLNNSWVEQALSYPHAGSWNVKDKKGKTIIIEGKLVTKNSNIISSGDYVEVMKTMADVMQVPDKELLKSNPLLFLNPLTWFALLKMLFQWKTLGDLYCNGYIRQINEIVDQKEPNDPVYIFTARELQKDGTRLLLGAAVFDIKKSYTNGTVELDRLIVTPQAQGRSISKILISSIFKLLPQTKRLILDVNCSNKQAIGVYEYLGFTKYQNNHEKLGFLSRSFQKYLFDYEYLTDSCTKLQDVAATFKNIKNNDKINSTGLEGV